MPLSSSWRPFAVAILLALTLPLSAVAEDLVPVELGSRFRGFALNPETGDLAALDPKASTITLFRSDFLTGKSKEKVGPVRVGAAPITPTAIAYKRYKSRGIFAVVGKQEGSVYLFDARDLSLVRKVPIATKDIAHLVGAPPTDNPFIYYSYYGGYEGGVGRINLARLADEGHVATGMVEVSISANGKVLFGQGRASSSVRSIRVEEVVGGDGKPNLQTVSEIDRLGGSAIADPHDFHVAIGPNVLTADLRNKLATLDFPIATFFASRPLIVGQADESIMLASYNSFELLARVELPSALLPKEEDDLGSEDWEQFGSVVRDPVLFADDGRGRIVAARGTHAVVIPLDQLNLPDEPLLVARLDGPARLTVGQQAKFKVTKADLKTQWKIAGPPEGMKVTEEGIEWTPTSEQVGPHELQLVLAHGELTKTISATIEVAYPHLQLPFWPGGIASSRDGKFAVAWSGLVPSPEFPGAMQPDQRTTHVAVIDLEKLAVIASAVLPFRASTAAIDQASVYVAAAENNYMQVFPLADPTKRKQVVADEPIVAIHPVNAKLVLVGTEIGRTLRYTLPELTRETPKGTTADDPPGESRSYPGFMDEDRDVDFDSINLKRLRDGWLIDGIVCDASTTKQRLMASPPGFFPLHDPSDRGIGLVYGSIQPERFDRWVGRDSDGGHSVTVEHESLPLKISAKVSYSQGRQVGDFIDREQNISVTLLDLEKGAASEIITLAKSRVSREGSPDGSNLIVDSAGQAVLIVIQGKVFRYVPGTLDLAQFRLPMRFEQEQTAFAADPKGAITLKHKLVGTKAPAQFALIMSRKELRLDVDSGELNVDGPGLVAAAKDYFVSEPFALSSLGQMVSSDRRLGETPEKTLQAYLDATAPTFERIVGRKPAGIPLIVPICLRAVDADSRIADLRYFIFVEVPADELTEKIKAHQTARTPAKVPNPANGTPAGTASDAERIKQLEDRMKALEGKIDLLMRLLQDQLQKEEEE